MYTSAGKYSHISHLFFYYFFIFGKIVINKNIQTQAEELHLW